MDIDLNRFFDLIVLAKNSGHYSEREIHFFYDIWDATRLKQLKSKYINPKDPKYALIMQFVCM